MSLRHWLGCLLLLSGISTCPLIGPASAGKVGSVAPDGTEPQVDLPSELHQKNSGGSDGSGLCVFASMRHSGLYQDEPVFAGLFQWMRSHPGGGYPDKVDKMVAQYARESGRPVPLYVQSEGADLDLLRAACRSGRMPGVTFDNAGNPLKRYSGQRIAHMVSLVGADVGAAHWWVILDNNYVGSDNLGFLTQAEFTRTFGDGWSVTLLAAGPPPPPRNGSPAPLPPLTPTPKPCPGPRPCPRP